MRFLIAFRNSLSDISWLKANRVSTVGAWRYFSSFIFLLTVVVALPIGLAAMPVVQEVRQVAEKGLPTFSATMASGTLSIAGLEQPFVVERNGMTVYVDTVATNTISRLNTNSITVSRLGVTVYNATTDREETRLWDIVPNGTATSEMVASNLLQLTSPTALVLWAFGFVLLLFITFFVIKVWLLIVVTSLVYLVGQLVRRPWYFKELFTMGLFAITLPTLLVMGLSMVGIVVPYGNTLALFAFMTAVVVTNDEVKE
jgi:hypothetical protein